MAEQCSGGGALAKLEAPSLRLNEIQLQRSSPGGPQPLLSGMCEWPDDPDDTLLLADRNQGVVRLFSLRNAEYWPGEMFRVESGRALLGVLFAPDGEGMLILAEGTREGEPAGRQCVVLNAYQKKPRRIFGPVMLEREKWGDVSMAHFGRPGRVIAAVYSTAIIHDIQVRTGEVRRITVPDVLNYMAVSRVVENTVWLAIAHANAKLGVYALELTPNAPLEPLTLVEGQSPRMLVWNDDRLLVAEGRATRGQHAIATWRMMRGRRLVRDNELVPASHGYSVYCWATVRGRPLFFDNTSKSLVLIP